MDRPLSHLFGPLSPAGKFNHLQTNSLHKETGNFQTYCRNDSSTNREIIAQPHTSMSPQALTWPADRIIGMMYRLM